jgi:hypothetical protein
MAPIAFFAVVIPWALVRGYSPDPYGYWLALSRPALYAIPWGQDNAYVYSPAFAQILGPLGGLSYPAFEVVWTMLAALALYAVAREWTPIALVIVGAEIGNNIFVLLALVIAFGERRPALWAFALLTKPTLGVCLLWFVVRREWVKLGEALAATAVIAGLSALVAPVWWGEWIAILVQNHSAWGMIIPLPLPARLVIALVIVIIAAGRGWPILLPVAALFALPSVSMNAPSMLVACIPLAGRARKSHADVGEGRKVRGGEGRQADPKLVVPSPSGAGVVLASSTASKGQLTPALDPGGNGSHTRKDKPRGSRGVDY